MEHDSKDLDLFVNLVNIWQAQEEARRQLTAEECKAVRDKAYLEPSYYVATEQEKRTEKRQSHRRTFMEEFDLTPGDILRVVAGVVATTVALIGIFKFMQVRDENFRNGLSGYNGYVQWVHDNGYEFSEDTYARYNSTENTYYVDNEKGL